MRTLKKHPKQQRMEDITFPLHKDKVIWEGREWLRSINDDNGLSLMNRLAWRVIAIAVFALAVIYCVAVLL